MDDAQTQQSTEFTNSSRKDALAHGALVDISDLGRAHGLHAPLAVTPAVYRRYVLLPGGPFQTDAVGSVWTPLHWLLVDLELALGAWASKVFRIQDDAN